ncbi:unnamed protein product [Periconia digitata]|uniref:Uncharacterized protein n=1 Tax=Periconia digitata TaxID=1303443 RepID=A0A9W4UDL9_9PLEO|nr:unnamed protein product [Periconia digitata]
MTTFANYVVRGSRRVVFTCEKPISDRRRCNGTNIFASNSEIRPIRVSIHTKTPHLTYAVSSAYAGLTRLKDQHRDIRNMFQQSLPVSVIGTCPMLNTKSSESLILLVTIRGRA